MEDLAITIVLEKKTKNYLVFGANGYLGNALCDYLANDETVEVVRATRSDTSETAISVSKPSWTNQISTTEKFDGVAWCQGMNSSGGLLEESESEILKVYQANVSFITSTLRDLIQVNALARPCRLVIFSSVWQELARPQKLSYILSKAAISGLVPALAADLAADEISVNAVLPGVVDSPMTRKKLTEDQIKMVEASTPGGQLVDALAVARVAKWLLCSESSGVNAQSIVVDNGWSRIRNV